MKFFLPLLPFYFAKEWRWSGMLWCRFDFCDKQNVTVDAKVDVATSECHAVNSGGVVLVLRTRVVS